MKIMSFRKINLSILFSFGYLLLFAPDFIFIDVHMYVNILAAFSGILIYIYNGSFHKIHIHILFLLVFILLLYGLIWDDGKFGMEAAIKFCIYLLSAKF